jgi:hypothetical protein
MPAATATAAPEEDKAVRFAQRFGHSGSGKLIHAEVERHNIHAFFLGRWFDGQSWALMTCVAASSDEPFGEVDNATPERRDPVERHSTVGSRTRVAGSNPECQH